jgi:hypothetical protein
MFERCVQVKLNDALAKGFLLVEYHFEIRTGRSPPCRSCYRLFPW